MDENRLKEFPTIKRTRVAHQTIDVIKLMIVRGELAPRQRLPAERDLAAQLGVSRPSLREAISALIALNILESHHGEGTFVSSLDPELLAEPIDFLLAVNQPSTFDLFEARKALETSLVALAAERATDEELDHLEWLVAVGEERLNDTQLFVEHDLEFHHRISDAAHSPILSSLFMSVSGALSFASRFHMAQSRDVREQAASDHRAVQKALKQRDPEAARRAMITHFGHALERPKA